MTRGYRAAAFGLAVLMACAVDASAQQASSLSGRILDQARGEPVEGALVHLQGTSHRMFTDSRGVFHFPRVRSDTYVLSVQHLTFGMGTNTLEVPDSASMDVTVWLASRAIELEPVVAEALSDSEREQRASGSRINSVTREEIESHSGSLSEILGARIPGITLDRQYRMGPVPTCVEFRRPPTLMSRGCHPPLVILDGIRISSPNWFLSSVPPQHIESVTVLPSSMAGVRYGTGASWGVIRIETRRPGMPRSIAPPPREALTTAYDWDVEPGGHPWPRTLGGAALGTVAGLALAWGVTQDCSPLNATRAVDCGGGGARLASLSTFVLPVAGGALAANLLGRTDQSQGRIALTALVTVMPMFMGYFFATPDDQVGFGGQQTFGRILVVAGVPIAATLADRIFRTSR